jgi:hypothetical protein
MILRKPVSPMTLTRSASEGVPVSPSLALRVSAEGIGSSEQTLMGNVNQNHECESDLRRHESTQYL